MYPPCTIVAKHSTGQLKEAEVQQKGFQRSRILLILQQLNKSISVHYFHLCLIFNDGTYWKPPVPYICLKIVCDFWPLSGRENKLQRQIWPCFKNYSILSYINIICWKWGGETLKNRYYLSKLSMKHHTIMIMAIMKNYNKAIKIQKAMEKIIAVGKNHCSQKKRTAGQGDEEVAKRWRKFAYVGMKGKNKTGYSEKS